MPKLIDKEFREAPPVVCNYYDKGPMDKRVLRTLFRRYRSGVEEWVIVHTFGRDYFRKDQWGDWKLHRTSDPDSVHKVDY